MVAATFKENAPDNEFADRLAKAISVYTAAGPSTNQMGSAWHLRIHAMIKELVASGEEGFRIAVELSTSRRSRVRRWATLHFGLARDPRGVSHLSRLLKDDSADVRRSAARWYTALIDRTGEHWGNPDRPAESVPQGIEELLPLVSDTNTKTRWTALRLLRAFSHLGDGAIEDVLQEALKDPKHKIRHEAARALAIPCPDCDPSTSN